MKKLAVTTAVLGLLATATPGLAGGYPSAADLHQVATVRNFYKVVIVDTAMSDRYIASKRAMNPRQPLTTLQQAILSNAALMARIRATVWSFDLKSAYAVNIAPDGIVYIYLGYPPGPT